MTGCGVGVSMESQTMQGMNVLKGDVRVYVGIGVYIERIAGDEITGSMRRMYPFHGKPEGCTSKERVETIWKAHSIDDDSRKDINLSTIKCALYKVR